jgi:putative ABC transport system permease protein
MAHLAQTLVVRSASSLGKREAGLAAAVKKAVAELDPDQPVTGIMTMEQSLARSVGDAQFYARLLEIFAIIALLLAAIGIYGSMSYFVTERTHEIGIRVALGAQRANILGLVTRLGLKLSCMGVAIGAALALGLTRVIARFLFGVTAAYSARARVPGRSLSTNKPGSAFRAMDSPRPAPPLARSRSVSTR